MTELQKTQEDAFEELEVLAEGGHKGATSEEALKYPLAGNDSHRLILSPLNPETELSFWLLARNAVGQGPVSEPFHYDPAERKRPLPRSEVNPSSVSCKGKTELGEFATCIPAGEVETAGSCNCTCDEVVEQPLCPI